MESIFNTKAKEDIQKRLEALTESSQAQWGKMNVNQMLVHCQKPIELALGNFEVKKPNFLKRFIFRMISPTLYNDKPWKRGLPTAQEFVIEDTKAFKTEKSKLKDCIEKLSLSKSVFEPYKKHPYFGKFTAEQWGKSAYKHLDHHLSQFGC